MSVDPRAFHANIGPSRAQVLHPRHILVDSSSSSSTSNLNNFHPIYDVDEPNCPRPHPLHIDLNAPVEVFVQQPVDQLMDQPTNPPVDQPITEDVLHLDDG